VQPSAAVAADRVVRRYQRLVLAYSIALPEQPNRHAFLSKLPLAEPTPGPNRPQGPLPGPYTPALALGNSRRSQLPKRLARAVLGACRTLGTHAGRRRLLAEGGLRWHLQCVACAHPLRPDTGGDASVRLAPVLPFPLSHLAVLLSGRYRLTRARVLQMQPMLLDIFKAPGIVGDVEAIYGCPR
jgi:hypothetical protein